MGNSLIIRKRSAKVMKLNGEITKYRTPVQAGKVLKDYPDSYVVLDAESVKNLGIRARPLDPWQELKPKKLYFLVELPPATVAAENSVRPETRRVRSVIHMSAKDRLETLMLSRRSSSDLMVTRHHREVVVPETTEGGPAAAGMRVKVWLPKAEVEKLMRESENEAEAAEKIAGLYMENKRVIRGSPEKVVVDGGNSRHVRWKD
ncbi:uncharacterized protein At1g66480-like [Impatiens glandulifera]|uniref:uncharacterized protein At1g66480-like n=1 Tax=Impatiens glandulifera TaxID=253017 RepID=UPI001FB1198A|nr:uncharacterized protein At1g66480-like [Impatiens glandulifera]